MKIEESGKCLGIFSIPVSGNLDQIIPPNSNGYLSAYDFHQGLVRFEDQGFPNVRELLDYHVKNRVPVTKKSKAIVVNPIAKEKDKWELCRESIVFQEKKLGQGHFGDVMKGILKPENIPVGC